MAQYLAIWHTRLDIMATRFDTNRMRQTARVRPGASLGLVPEPTSSLIRRLERGLPFKSIQRLSAAAGMPISEIAKILAIPERTLARRRVSGLLTTDESERLFRVSRVFDRARSLFDGDGGTALAWLKSPARALGNRVPLEQARFEAGAHEVENLIGRIEDGIFS
jgi:putative toxin-antitoxin system antitoxin component (TIGR02293 family)